MPTFALPAHSKPRVTATSTVAHFLGTFTKKHHRASGFLLFFLALVAVFSLFANNTHDTAAFIADRRARGHNPSSSYPLSRAFSGDSKRLPRASPQATLNEAEPLRLTPSMELGALVAFVTDRNARNALPTTLDPQAPIPADVILDFNTRSDFAQVEVDELVQDTWTRNPLVVFTKVHSPQGRDLKKILASYKVKPEPAILNVDERQDAAVLEPLLYRLTGQKSLPITLLAGHAIGSLTDIAKAHESGELKRVMQNAGITFVQPKKKQQIPAPKLN